MEIRSGGPLVRFEPQPQRRGVQQAPLSSDSGAAATTPSRDGVLSPGGGNAERIEDAGPEDGYPSNGSSAELIEAAGPEDGYPSNGGNSAELVEEAGPEDGYPSNGGTSAELVEEVGSEDGGLSADAAELLMEDGGEDGGPDRNDDIAELLVDVPAHTIGLAGAKRVGNAPGCKKVLDKARRLLLFDMQKNSARKRRLGAQVQALADLVAEKKGEAALLKTHAALGMVGLGTGLWAGEVWTSEDQNELINLCYPKGATEPLEEHTATDEGEAIVEGDMALAAGALEALPWGGPWAAGQVRFCYEHGTRHAARLAFRKATRHVEAQVPCVKFSDVGTAADGKQCSEMPSILVRSRAHGCWSHVGQVSGNFTEYKDHSQKLNLGRGCELLGMAAHQLGHALGMLHATSRIDRDQHLRLRQENLAASSLVTAFSMTNGARLGEAHTNVTFDILSLMGYSSRAFSVNGKVTVEPRREPLLRYYLGQRMGLSELDVLQLGEMYGCPAKVKPLTRSQLISGLFVKGMGLHVDGVSCKDQGYTSVLAADGDDGEKLSVSCDGLTDKCMDPKIGPSVRTACPSMCNLCVSVPEQLARRVGRQTRDRLGKYSKSLAAGPAKSPGLPPVTSCVDAVDTGIRFQNSNVPATCLELQNYCNHATLGKKVKIACVKTCGRCQLRRDLVKRGGCEDLPARALPHFTLGGQTADCPGLRQFCRGHADSEMIMQKCPRTCGRCLGVGETTTTPASATSGTTTQTYTFSTAVDEHTRGVGCRRRRRWGFCHQRRRRDR